MWVNKSSKAKINITLSSVILDVVPRNDGVSRNDAAPPDDVVPPDDAVPADDVASACCIIQMIIN